MRILWLNVSYAVALISSSSWVLCSVSIRKAVFPNIQHSQQPGLGLRATSISLSPPDKQEVLYDLVLQSILSCRILEEFNGVLDLVRFEVGGRAFVKG